MKSQYEDRTRLMLPRRTFTVIRCDGKAFHTYARGCEKPFDAFLHAAMVKAAIALCEEAQGSKIGYVQSDEISIILTDFDRIETCAWFDGNVQKMSSVAASCVTASFNARMPVPFALFDARVFTIPDPVEVENYLIWRQKDAIRNSVSGLAQRHFSQKQLDRKSREEMLAMLATKGVEWSAQPTHVQRGTVIRYDRHAERGNWVADDSAPLFTEDREFVRRNLIPRID
jgi:tRNA(His) 5'-end guanylyltransferase